MNENEYVDCYEYIDYYMYATEIAEGFGYWLEVGVAAIAFVALLVGIVTALIQISLQKNEWRPYLSYKSITGEIDPFRVMCIAIATFGIELKNVGKVPLCYKVEKFDVKTKNLSILGRELGSEVTLEKCEGGSSEKGAIPVASGVNHIWNLSHPLVELPPVNNLGGLSPMQDESDRSERLANAKCEITLEIHYYHPKKPKKDYMLAFTASCSIVPSQDYKPDERIKKYRIINASVIGDSVRID